MALRFTPFGVNLRAAGGSPELLDLVAAICGPLANQAETRSAPITVRLELLEGAADTSAPIQIEASARFLQITGGGVRVSADGAARCGEAAIPAAWLRSPGRLRAEIVEPFLMFLICRADRTPLHASALRIGDAAILLAGPSGAGKSTLALAAWAAGLQVFAEDIVYLQREPALQVWGGVSHIHVFPDDAPDGWVGPIRLRNGKRKRAIDLGRTIASNASRAVLCILDKGPKVDLAAVDQATAMAALSDLEPGFDLLREGSLSVLSALTAKGAWRLTLAANPHEAVACLVGRQESLLSRASP